MNILKGLSALCLFLICGQAWANQIPHLSLDDLVKNSRLVVMATALEVIPKQATLDRHQRFRITRVLKGSAGQYVKVFTQGPTAEDHITCCVRGRGYLLFLRGGTGGYWESTNSSYGFVEIK